MRQCLRFCQINLRSGQSEGMQQGRPRCTTASPFWPTQTLCLQDASSDQVAMHKTRHEWPAHCQPSAPAGLVECRTCRDYRSRHKGEPRPERLWKRQAQAAGKGGGAARKAATPTSAAPVGTSKGGGRWGPTGLHGRAHRPSKLYPQPLPLCNHGAYHPLPAVAGSTASAAAHHPCQSARRHGWRCPASGAGHWGCPACCCCAAAAAGGPGDSCLHAAVWGHGAPAAAAGCGVDAAAQRGGRAPH